MRPPRPFCKPIQPEFKTRADLALSVPPAGLMIELGVARGQFAAQLMATNPDAFYLGVDRYADRGHDDGEFLAASNAITLGGGRLWRMEFAVACERIGDCVADLVYVDGYAHEGNRGGSTMEAWWPKVCGGGILAGHDYHPQWPKNMAAVDAFVARHRLVLHVIDERPYPSWWVRC